MRWMAGATAEMAVRATRKAKVPGGTRAPQKAAAVKKSASRKAPAKSVKSKSGAKAAKKTTAARGTKAGAVADVADAPAHEFLLDQNEALKAELEQAHARIAELEELNRNVANRIDWVIDSLQGELES